MYTYFRLASEPQKAADQLVTMVKNILEEYPGYEKIRIAPLPDKRLDWLEASLKTRHGQIRSRWQKQEVICSIVK